MSRRLRPAFEPPSIPVPDRPLEPAADLPTLSVRTGGNHPFIYRKMVVGHVGATRASDGDLVRVVDRDHLPLGYALWNNRSKIALRILTPSLTPPGVDFWRDRITRASPCAARRSSSTKSPTLTACSMPKATAFPD